MNENNNNQNTFKCSGDCLKCSFQQRVYCSSQMSRNAIDMIGAVLENQKSILERFERVEKAIQSKGEEIVNPMAETPSDGLNEHILDNAQQDVGAENRASD